MRFLPLLIYLTTFSYGEEFIPVPLPEIYKQGEDLIHFTPEIRANESEIGILLPIEMDFSTDITRGQYSYSENKSFYFTRIDDHAAFSEVREGSPANFIKIVPSIPAREDAKTLILSKRPGLLYGAPKFALLKYRDGFFTITVVHDSKVGQGNIQDILLLNWDKKTGALTKIVREIKVHTPKREPVVAASFSPQALTLEPVLHIRNSGVVANTDYDEGKRDCILESKKLAKIFPGVDLIPATLEQVLAIKDHPKAKKFLDDPNDPDRCLWSSSWAPKMETSKAKKIWSYKINNEAKASEYFTGCKMVCAFE